MTARQTWADPRMLGAIMSALLSRHESWFCQLVEGVTKHDDATVGGDSTYLIHIAIARFAAVSIR
jgi:hypothetical protein